MTAVVEHKIPTGTAQPVKQLPRRIPHTLKEEVDKQVTLMLDTGIVSCSNSQWSSPVVLVKKCDGGVRFCVDYRRLNAVTVKDSYPLPRIDYMLDALSGARYFTTLDWAAGYWQRRTKRKLHLLRKSVCGSLAKCFLDWPMCQQPFSC